MTKLDSLIKVARPAWMASNKEILEAIKQDKMIRGLAVGVSAGSMGAYGLSQYRKKDKLQQEKKAGIGKRILDFDKNHPKFLPRLNFVNGTFIGSLLGAKLVDKLTKNKKENV
jgi:hypothetical protein